MDGTFLLILLAAALCAAAGQLLFKVGAGGQTTLMDFVNAPILVGLGMYAFSAALWIGALSRAPLIIVYPFTVLTFVLVYGGSILFLQERPTLLGLVGVGIVVVGLYLIVASQPSRVPGSLGTEHLGDDRKSELRDLQPFRADAIARSRISKQRGPTKA